MQYYLAYLYAFYISNYTRRSKSMLLGYNTRSVAGKIKKPNLIDMLVFTYASSEHDCNYKCSLNVQPQIL